MAGRADLLNMGNPIGRAIAFALGMFALLNIRGAENLWWIDVRPLPQAILALPGALLALHALRPELARPLVKATACTLLGVLAFNSARYWTLPLHAAPAIPLTVAVAGLLVLVLRSPRLSRPRLAMVTTLALLALGLPLAQAASFGRTDYRRPADAIVVFGARTYADGTPSDALADRVRTACALYHEPDLFTRRGRIGSRPRDSEGREPARRASRTTARHSGRGQIVEIEERVRRRPGGVVEDER